MCRHNLLHSLLDSNSHITSPDMSRPPCKFLLTERVILCALLYAGFLLDLLSCAKEFVWSGCGSSADFDCWSNCYSSHELIVFVVLETSIRCLDSHRSTMSFVIGHMSIRLEYVAIEDLSASPYCSRTRPTVPRRLLLKLHNFPLQNTTSNGGSPSGVCTPRSSSSTD
jgi:hypothetical protein